MELTVTNRSRAYPGRSSGDSKVDDVQYVVLKVCYLCTSGSVVEYRLAKARVAGSNPVSCSQRDRKRVIQWMALFSMFEPCRARTVRMSTLRSGRRRRTSPGRSATSRALKEMRKRGDIRWVSLFLYVRSCQVRTVRSSTLRCGRCNNFKYL